MIDFSIPPELEATRGSPPSCSGMSIPTKGRCYVQGQTHDKRFQNFDGLVRELVSEALALAQGSRI